MLKLGLWSAPGSGRIYWCAGQIQHRPQLRDAELLFGDGKIIWLVSRVALAWDLRGVTLTVWLVHLLQERDEIEFPDE